MTFGLSSKAIDEIVAVLQRHPRVAWATLFGSRALGRERSTSDVDLVLGGDVDELEVERIALELDELQLPVRFDLKDDDAIRYPPLRAHIDRVGKVFYRQV